MPQPLRIGFVGAGDIVRTRHYPNLQNIEDIELVSVCNSSDESNERAAQEMGLRKIFHDWRDLVEDNEIDIVWIGTWPYLHCPVTLAALEAGKHVFCQARMAMNLDEARRMLKASQASDRVTMLCPPPMGMKGDWVMLSLLNEDQMVGDIYSLHFRDLSGSFHDPQGTLHWRQQESLSGLNTLTVGIYAEVIHRWFGYTKSITAQAKTFITQRKTPDGTTAPVTRPDVVLALCEMQNGALMRWEWSGLVASEPICVLEVFGSQGALVYDFLEDTILLKKQDEEWQEIPIPPERERRWTVERDFIDAIREGKEVHPDFSDGVKYMEFTDALFQSAETGNRIDLPV